MDKYTQQGVVGEGLSGRLAGVALYADVLSPDAVRLLYRAGTLARSLARYSCSVRVCVCVGGGGVREWVGGWVGGYSALSLARPSSFFIHPAFSCAMK